MVTKNANLTMNIDQYAVFGHPISHSKSPRIHEMFAKQTNQNISYKAQEVPATEFNSAVRHFFDEGGKGLNCTVPLKELAWQYATQLTNRARLSKAVNTLAIQADGNILGDNTDGIGLINDLTINHNIPLFQKRILILGAGGATRGILEPLLSQQPHSITIANRTASKAHLIVSEFQSLGTLYACDLDQLGKISFELIINATSASLNNELPPLPQNLLASGGYCYDLAYSNQTTPFVRWGNQHNAQKSLDGLGMLVEQAAEAFYLWRGIRPETLPVIQLLNDERMVST